MIGDHRDMEECLYPGRRMEIQRLNVDVDYLKWVTTTTLVLMVAYIGAGILLTDWSMLPRHE